MHTTPIAALARAILICAILPVVATMPAGCTGAGTPVASMIRLASISPMDADPGDLRFAVSTPRFMRVRDGDLTVTIRFDTGDTATSFLEQIRPVIEEDAQGAPGIDVSALAGRRLTIAKFSREDAEAFRSVQVRVKRLRDAGIKGKGSLSVGATGCVTAAPTGAIPISAWLQTHPGDDFFLLMKDADLRKQLEAAGVGAVRLPLCGQG